VVGDALEDMPDSPPSTIGEFRARLLQLRLACGSPSYSKMRTSARSLGVGQLAPATISDFIAGKHPHALPRKEFFRPFVAGCLAQSGRGADEVQRQLEIWDEWWGQLVLAGTQPPPPAPPDPEPVAPAEPPAPPASRRRLRPVLIAALVLVLGAVLGGSVVRWLDTRYDGPDPSLDYGTCAETIGHSTVVGSIALSAERGPPGRADQDRSVELRVQKHPVRGWIAWSRLTRSTSPLDRLWLDWSYIPTPTADLSQFRQCGAQPVADGVDTVGLLVVDEQGRKRWFRACGQVPVEDRAPDRTGTFCTSWTRPRVG
jgi:hypothetical protein